MMKNFVTRVIDEFFQRWTFNLLSVSLLMPYFLFFVFLSFFISLKKMFRPWRILGKVMEVVNKAKKPLGDLNQRKAVKSGDWDKLMRPTVKGIVGNRAQLKFL